MKLAKIILPERDNNNETLVWQHQALKDQLIANFGGYTATKGHGGWDAGRGRVAVEPVWVYDVAMERAATPTLRSIAQTLAADAKQDCVMIVTPNGDVEFVKPKRLDDNHKVD
jgi:hypothetical protein